MRILTHMMHDHPKPEPNYNQLVGHKLQVGNASDLSNSFKDLNRFFDQCSWLNAWQYKDVVWVRRYHDIDVFKDIVLLHDYRKALAEASHLANTSSTGSAGLFAAIQALAFNRALSTNLSFKLFTVSSHIKKTLHLPDSLTFDNDPISGNCGGLCQSSYL
jgi:hypothetical protein